MKLHHVGIVVPNIAVSEQNLCEVLAMRSASPQVSDPQQRSHLVLLADTHGSTIELIEPHAPGSPAARSAASGGGLAHLCYETPDLEREVARMREAGALLIQRPTPAVLFHGRRVAFVYLRSKVVIELLEAPL
jgi:methylmalonyl-CoA/ethylmalonyl-CoA epimerase